MKVKLIITALLLSLLLLFSGCATTTRYGAGGSVYGPGFYGSMGSRYWYPGYNYGYPGYNYWYNGYGYWYPGDGYYDGYPYGYYPYNWYFNGGVRYHRDHKDGSWRPRSSDHHRGRRDRSHDYANSGSYTGERHWHSNGGSTGSAHRRGNAGYNRSRSAGSTYVPRSNPGVNVHHRGGAR